MGLFKKKHQTPTTPTTRTFPVPTTRTDYPVGACIKTEKGYFLINSDGKRYRIITDRIFDSWSFSLVITTSEAAVKHYPVAVTKLPFRDGSLLINHANGKMYLVSEKRLRHITSPDVLDRLGVSYSDFTFVSQEEINIMRLGEEIK